MKKFNILCFVISSIIGLLLSTNTALAEGIYQLGSSLNQPLDSTTNMFVHVPNDGDIIRIHLCRSDGDTNSINADIHSTFVDTDGIYTKEPTVLQALSSTQANIDCADSMTNPLPQTPVVGSLMEFAVPIAGVYGLSLDDSSSISYDRWDISIVPSSTPTASVDPTSNDGYVFSYRWRIEATADTVFKTSATSANLYTIVSGGFSDSNYVWQLDFNEFSGSGYELVSNSIGAASPASGSSAPIAGNSVIPSHPVYLSYPTGATPANAPSSSPAITDTFNFIDDAGNDSTFSPDGDATEETGNFSFTSDVDGTYAITIDLNNDGVFNSGDRIISGETTANVTNQINWDGTDASGSTVLNGSYAVQLELRVGEAHFVVRDAETSGGGTNDDGSVFEGGTGDDDGLTILQATNSSTNIATIVYWDDETLLTGGSNIPTGVLSSAAISGIHRHTWGDFTGAGVGDANYIDTFVYGNSSTVTTTLASASNNAVPTIDDATFDINENIALSTSIGTVTSADADGDFLTHSITSGNTDSVFSIEPATGEITVNGSLNADITSQYILNVQVTDQANSVSATITIDINNLNEAPTISGMPATTVNEDSSYLFTPIGYDDDGDELSYSISNQPSWANFDVSDGTLSGTPINTDVGSYPNIQITVSSEGPLTADLTSFTITVINTNDAPIASDDIVSTDEDSFVQIDVLANDTDSDTGDNLTILSIDSVSSGSAAISSNQIDYTPLSDLNGTATITYTVTDGVETDTATVVITINPVDDAPIISGTPATSLTQDSSYLFTPSASDVDGDELSFSIVNAPSWSSFDSVSGSLTGIPTNNDVGSYTGIRITVTSTGDLSADLADFAIEVTNINDAPDAADDSSTTDEDMSITIDVLANDNDIDVGDSLTISGLNSVINGSAVIDSNQVLFTPDPEFSGIGSFNYTMTDGISSDTASVTITINQINDAPEISGTPPTTALQDNPYSFTPTATDA
ncbi:MAG: tandem-95 repeat protein, partial [Kangiellaceae bacterium]|nr:tandem-95 repeat protein [Kangiellaceae bacterium]